MVDKYECLCFLSDCFINPCGCILLAVTCADKGQVFAGNAQCVGIILHGAVLDGVFVEKCEELAIHVVLTGVAVALEWYGFIGKYVHIFDFQRIENALDVNRLILVCWSQEVALDVIVDVKHVAHLLG